MIPTLTLPTNRMLTEIQKGNAIDHCGAAQNSGDWMVRFWWTVTQATQRFRAVFPDVGEGRFAEREIDLTHGYGRPQNHAKYIFGRWYPHPEDSGACRHC